MWSFSIDSDSGVMVRDVQINTRKGGEPVKIIQMTDLHLNYCTDEELKNPTLAGTWQNRVWQKVQRDGEGAYRNVNPKNFSIRNMESCIRYIDREKPDQLVITGDIFDYLSEGNALLAKSYIFDRYPTALACLGNHEVVQQMQGDVAESLSLADRMAALEGIWRHDIHYVSKVLGDKVMLVVMDNCRGGRYGSVSWTQEKKLRTDLAEAREKGYTVILFYHIPLATENPAYRSTCAEEYVKGDAGTAVWDFQTKGICSSAEDEATVAVYKLITSNADVIAAAFCGHKHNDYVTEINATDAVGERRVIPQYILIGTVYGGSSIKGNVLRITVN